jgi:Tfp pilus assembly protein PilZ
MFENNRDSVEVPIDLRFPKVRSEEEEPLQLRRQKRRSYEQLRLDVEVSPWSESNFYAGLNGDGPQAGLFVATYRPMRLGERVLLRFEMFGEPIEVDGMVRWRRVGSEYAPPGVGVAFGDLAPRARRLIDAFCARRAPMYYDLENDL